MKKLVLMLTLLLPLSTFAQSYFQQLYNQGRQQQKKGEYYPAIKSYSSAIDFGNKEQKAKAKKQIEFCAARLNSLLNDSRLIIDAFLPENRSNTYIYFKERGDSLYSVGEYLKAKQNYTLAKISPECPSINLMKKALQKSEQCELWQNNALLLIKKEEYSEAELEIKKVLEQNPDSRKTILIASAINPKYGLINIEGGGFKIGRYEVTNFEYFVFLNRYKSDVVKKGEHIGEKMIYEHQRGVIKNNNTNKWQCQAGMEFYPVLNVTWYGAYEFACYYGLNLPKKTEWEKIESKEKRTTESNFELNSLIQKSWHRENSQKQTHEVGLLLANESGVYDFLGNIKEWLADSFFEENIDLLKISSKEYKIIKGGSWFETAEQIVTLKEEKSEPYKTNSIIGFRIVENN